jgi:hypothetical protein
MTESLSPFGSAVTQVVSHWTGKKAHSVRNDVLGLVLEQSAAAQTTPATIEEVAVLAARHGLDDGLTTRSGEQPSVAEALACQEILTARGIGPFQVPGARITVPDLLDFDQEGWLTLLDLFDHVPRHWALVGGQMIHLHCWQRARPAPRVTTDADLIMDIRAKRTVLATVTAFLQERGFQEDGRSPTNVGHRWKRDRLSFDVLLPEGLSQAGARTSTVTGARTLQVPGGTQAIDRAQSVEVDIAGRVGRIIRPSLLGALVGKAAALEIPVDPNVDRHSSDFITLASLIDNPAGMNALVTRRDRTRAAAMLSRLPESDPAWQVYGTGPTARGTAIMTFGLDTT